MEKRKYLEEIERTIQAGPYQDSWESLCQHVTPKWYKNDKFGIFIHWGVYSVPAFGNEWYARYVYRKNSPENKFHIKKYGALNQFGYKDFIPMFQAKKYVPDEWAKLFKAAGARFVMPVAEHHDGFQMYGSQWSPWNAENMGPKKDVLGELKTAVEKEELKFCTSSHRAEHWWFYNYGNSYPCDVSDPQYQDFYGPSHGPSHDVNDIYDNPPDQGFLEDWLVRTCEIVDKYQPKIMFFDWWIQQVAFKPYLKKFAAYYYNRAVQWGEEVAIDAKFDAFVHGSVVKDIERGQLSGISTDFWQNDTSVANNSWGYTEGNIYKKPESIIQDLVDVVSKNGAFLLNIGPKADGTIPEEDTNILQEIGKWMKKNGEAIYDTIPWKVFGEGPTLVPEGHFTDTQHFDFTSEDIRYTAKSNSIYAIVMKWPEDGKVILKEVGRKAGRLRTAVKRISILGYDIDPLFEYRDCVEIEAHIQADEYPVVLKLEIL